MLTGAAPVFVVNDVATSLVYYRDCLGFEIAFEYGEPTFYVGVCRDEVAIHLVSGQNATRAPGQSGICIFVDDVDAIYAELVRRGARVVKPPQDYDYGMRDFDALDLDGNRLIYGMGSKL